jgi:hypothetical protein
MLFLNFVFWYIVDVCASGQYFSHLIVAIRVESINHGMVLISIFVGLNDFTGPFDVGWFGGSCDVSLR